MALIKCSECGKEISDKAQTCPNCGNPLGQPKEKIVTVEHTSKKWKKSALWGLVFAFFGLFTITSSVGLAAFFFFIAFVFIIRSRIGAWWTNG